MPSHKNTPEAPESLPPNILDPVEAGYLVVSALDVEGDPIETRPGDLMILFHREIPDGWDGPGIPHYDWSENEWSIVMLVSPVVKKHQTLAPDPIGMTYYEMSYLDDRGHLNVAKWQDRETFLAGLTDDLYRVHNVYDFADMAFFYLLLDKDDPRVEQAIKFFWPISQV